MRRIFLKLRRRRSLQRDLETELAFHREMSALHGNSIPLGNTTAIKEEGLGLWRFTFVENLWRDVKYALRSLQRSPTLVITALVSLALGIGVNTTIFSLGMEFLFSEPTVRDAPSLVYVKLGGNSHARLNALEFVKRSGLFQDVAGENEESFINWDNGSETRPIFCVYTTKNYFSELGVPMSSGRGYGPEDPKEVAVLSYQFWRRHFNGDPSVVGREIRLDGRAYTVTGILTARQRTLIGFGFSPDVYVPAFLNETVLAMYARLQPGMSLASARAGLRTVARRLDAEIPAPWKNENECSVSPIAGLARFESQGDMLTIGVFFGIVMVVVGLVLLIACVNVASLLLARASARRREIAIRISLGASRGRLFQQLFVDSVLLSAGGAVIALALCDALAGVLAQIHLPAPIPLRLQAQIDWRVAIYAAVLTIGAAVVCGLLPAWRFAKNTGHSGMSREGRLRLRRALVTAQVAISVLVLATGFLFLRNLLRATAMSPGFDLRHTLRAEVNLPPLEYRNLQQINAYADQAVRRLSAIPGIQAAAAACIIPFTDSWRMASDLVFPDTGEQVHAQFHWNAVTPAYFDAIGIPILAGRTFPAGQSGGRRLAIVNRTFVEQYLGRRNPVGAVFRWGRDGEIYQIVAMVETTKNITIGEAPRPQMYVPLSQSKDQRTRIQFVMRSATPPAAQIQPVRNTLRQLEPGAGLEVATLYSSIGVAFLPSQVGAALLGSLGVLGLALAMIGLYGVLVYSVTRQTHEIGVRIAIGASRMRIGRMILLEALKLVSAGSAIGIFVAIFALRPLAAFLVPGLHPDDPLTLLAVVGCFAVTAFMAVFGPMRRALGIDPAQCLRYE